MAHNRRMTTFTALIDQMYANLDEDNRARDLMPVDDLDPDAYDRFIPGDRVARDCYFDGDHRDADPDYHDGVMRCTDCDAPVSPFIADPSFSLY